MAPLRIVYYVSGHGHGHARRAAEISKSILRLNPESEIVVRSTVPPAIFEGIPRCSVTDPSPWLDSGAIEDDILTINKPATLARVREVLRKSSETIALEAAYFRDQKFNLILSDIPFLSADIAEEVNSPSLGISNFTWDFIYEPLLEACADKQEILGAIRSSYSKFSAFIQLPFSHPIPAGFKSFRVGLMAQTTARGEDDILNVLGISSDSRPIVLFAMRSGLPPVSKFAREGADFLFFVPGPAADDWPENVRPIPRGPDLGFVELLKVADAAVSKVGFGVLADCIASGTGLLFPIKEGFKEDELTEDAAARYMRSWPIPRHDFESGNWAPYLRTILSMPAPRESLSLSGADECAEIVKQFVSR